MIIQNTQYKIFIRDIKLIVMILRNMQVLQYIQCIIIIELKLQPLAIYTSINCSEEIVCIEYNFMNYKSSKLFEY